MPSKAMEQRAMLSITGALVLISLAACGGNAPGTGTTPASTRAAVTSTRADSPAASPAPAGAVEVPPAMHSPDQAPGQATPAAAQETLRRYYGAINAKDYAAAYALWSNHGASSRQSAEDFAQGYARTLMVDARIGEPGKPEGAAGSRYIRVPVDLASAQADGSSRHYRGSFTLRAVVADGATPEQQQWHLDSAELEGYEPSQQASARAP
jgi:hypothetical protein